jgi:hypothetical protein
MGGVSDENEPAEPRFHGQEFVEIEPGVVTALAYVKAGALLMARFRNRLDDEQAKARKALPHAVKFGMVGSKIVCESKIY